MAAQILTPEPIVLIGSLLIKKVVQNTKVLNRHNFYRENMLAFQLANLQPARVTKMAGEQTMAEINLNEVAATAVSALVKDFITSLASAIPKKIDNFIKRYFNNFEQSIERNLKTCSTVRTIINKDRPIPIDEIYVKSKYKCNNKIYDDDNLCQYIRDGQRVVVTGFGGIGKTVFCKYLWMSIFNNPMGKVPVFFELRNLNDITNQNLEAYLRLSLTITDSVIPSEVFREILKSGQFIFIFDGFDEVPDNLRNEIQKQILELSKNYPLNGIVVSSRADDRFNSWHEFFNYTVVGFDKDQARSVIEKIDFDKDIKREFITEILEKIYQSYKGFFSTPLLSLMMLMTYNQIRYVPDSPHIFYRYAFQTLYTLHDASKQGFQRKRYVDMSESQFINVFSLFCLVTYIDMEHSFVKGKILDHLNAVKSRAKV